MEKLAVSVAVFQARANESPDLRTGGCGRPDVLGGQLVKLLHSPSQSPDEELGFGWEVTVDRALSHSGKVCDFIDRGGLVTLRGKYPPGSLEALRRPEFVDDVF